MKSKTKRGREVTWTLLELRGLIEEENSCVYFERARKHLALHPFYLTNLQTALNEILKSTLNTYDTDLKGFIIAYKNPKLLTSFGEIYCDTCFIHIDIEADFYLFRPEVGSCLRGIVNKKGLDHIVILVHKTYTVSIPKIDNKEGEWLGNLVDIGQEIKCCVTQIDRSIKLPFICATLNNDYLQGCWLSNTILNTDDIDTVIESGNIDNSSKMIDKYDRTTTLEDNVSDRDKKNRKKHMKKFRQSDSKSVLKYKVETELIDNSTNNTSTNVQYKYKSKQCDKSDIDISMNNTEINDILKKYKKHKNTPKESNSESESQVRIKIEKPDLIIDTQCNKASLNNDVTDVCNINLNGYIELRKGMKREYPITDTASELEKKKKKKKHTKKYGESNHDSVCLTEDEKQVANNIACHVKQLDDTLINMKKHKKHKKSKISPMTMSDSEFEDRVIKIKIEKPNSFLDKIDEKSHGQMSSGKNVKYIDTFTETLKHIKREESDRETKKRPNNSNLESAFKIKSENKIMGNSSRTITHKFKSKEDEEQAERTKYDISNVRTSPSMSVKVK